MFCFPPSHRQDFILTIVFVALWLVCSSAWAKGLQNVRDATSTAGIQSTLSVCQAQGVVCQVTERANMRTLSVSVVSWIETTL